jgi:hypothetical protein
MPWLHGASRETRRHFEEQARISHWQLRFDDDGGKAILDLAPSAEPTLEGHGSHREAALVYL